MVKFEVVNDGQRARYDGPHGPFWIGAGQDPATAVLETGDGEDRLEFGMARPDLEALDAGVSARIAGDAYQLRRDGKALLLLDEAGAPRVIVRRGRFGKLRLERPDGHKVAEFAGLEGKVDEQVAAVEVRLMLLLALAGCNRALERGAAGSLLPFP